MLTMDFSVVGSSSSVMSILAELLSAEKDDTRGWLRAEMDRLVDPMLDSIFNRLETKLINGLERTQSSGGTGNWTHDQLPNVHLHQPSISTHLNSQHAITTNYESQTNESNSFDPCSLDQSPVPRSPMSITNAQITFKSNELTNSIPIKHVIEPTATVQPSTAFHFDQNEHHEQLIIKDEVEDCDCDECVYGIIEVKEEDEDAVNYDDDSVQLIEDYQEDEESVPSVKRPRLDSTQRNKSQSEEARLSPRQPTDEAQPNQVHKQIITVYLKCIDSQCPATFPEDQLNQHMFDAHSIGPSRCLLKDCKQSFDNNTILGRHLKHSHQSTSQWHCDKCPKHFPKYKALSEHNKQCHQLGHYECSFPACTFTGQYRMKVFNHYAQQHKLQLVCSQPDCNYRTYIGAVLKSHERAHLGIKPYRCKWSNCDYSSSYQHAALSHIRTHLARAECSNQDGAHSIDPKDYLEVASELL